MATRLNNQCRYNGLKEAGLCVVCGLCQRSDRSLACATCVGIRAARKVARRLLSKELGLCIECSTRPAVNNLVRCAACISDHSAANKAYRQSLRFEALQYYGMTCARCPESIYQFLVIDHVNDDGWLHRAIDGVGSGASFYKWLRDNNYPDGFQTLCWNCNWQKYVEFVSKHASMVKKAIDHRHLVAANKDLVLQAYGRQCRCCGNSNILVLVIDHVDGYGNAHKESIGLSGSVAFYQWLIAQGFPNGFQTLCCNCNNGRALNGGTCPHILGANDES